jgi:hypothetical protein
MEGEPVLMRIAPADVLEWSRAVAEKHPELALLVVNIHTRSVAQYLANTGLAVADDVGATFDYTDHHMIELIAANDASCRLFREFCADVEMKHKPVDRELANSFRIYIRHEDWHDWISYLAFFIVTHTELYQRTTERAENNCIVQLKAKNLEARVACIDGNWYFNDNAVERKALRSHLVPFSEQQKCHEIQVTLRDWEAFPECATWWKRLAVRLPVPTDAALTRMYNMIGQYPALEMIIHFLMTHTRADTVVLGNLQISSLAGENRLCAWFPLAPARDIKAKKSIIMVTLKTAAQGGHIMTLVLDHTDKAAFLFDNNSYKNALTYQTSIVTLRDWVRKEFGYDLRPLVAPAIHDPLPGRADGICVAYVCLFACIQLRCPRLSPFEIASRLSKTKHLHFVRQMIASVIEFDGEWPLLHDFKSLNAPTDGYHTIPMQVREMPWIGQQDAAEIEGKIDDVKADIQKESLPQNLPVGLRDVVRMPWLDEILAIDEQAARDIWQPNNIQEITDPQQMHILLAYLSMELAHTEMTLAVESLGHNSNLINAKVTLEEKDDGSHAEVLGGKKTTCVLTSNGDILTLQWNSNYTIAWMSDREDGVVSDGKYIKNMRKFVQLLPEDPRSILWCMFLIVLTAHLLPAIPVDVIFETLGRLIRTPEEARGLLARFLCRLLPIHREILRQVPAHQLFAPPGSLLL